MPKSVKLFLISLFTLILILIPVKKVLAATLEIEPSDDAYVDIHNPNTNFGNAIVLYSDYKNFIKYALIKFSLTSIPSHSTISSAKFKIFVNQASTMSIYKLELHRITNNWSQNSVTWQNQPAKTPAMTKTFNQIAYIEFDVSDLVKKWFSGVYPNYGLEIVNGFGNYCRYDSKESSTDHPKLVVNYTLPADTTGPVISNISVWPITVSSARINWTTNEISSSDVLCYISQEANSLRIYQNDGVLNHSVTLTNLTPRTTYYYKVHSQDRANNSTSSQARSFTTSAGIVTVAQSRDTQPPRISNIHLLFPNTTTCRFTWTTDEPANGQVDVWPSGALRRTFNQPGNTYGNSHSADASISPNTNYNYQIKSKDRWGNQGVTLVNRFQSPAGGFVSPLPGQTNLIISNVNTDITANAITVTWQTNKIADSTVTYLKGESTSENEVFRDGTPMARFDRVLNHSITLGNLTPSTAYSYIINSTGENETYAKSLLFHTQTTQGDSGPPNPSDEVIPTETPLPDSGSSFDSEPSPPSDTTDTTNAPDTTETTGTDYFSKKGSQPALNTLKTLLASQSGNNILGFQLPNLARGILSSLLFQPLGMVIGLIILAGLLLIPIIIIFLIIVAIYQKKKTQPAVPIKTDKKSTVSQPLKVTKTEVKDTVAPEVKADQSVLPTASKSSSSKIFLFLGCGCGCLILLIIFCLIFFSSIFNFLPISPLFPFSIFK